MKCVGSDIYRTLNTDACSVHPLSGMGCIAVVSLYLFIVWQVTARVEDGW